MKDIPGRGMECSVVVIGLDVEVSCCVAPRPSAWGEEDGWAGEGGGWGRTSTSGLGCQAIVVSARVKLVDGPDAARIEPPIPAGIWECGEVGSMTG